MKNLLKSTLYLFVFAIAGILFQISCSNSDDTNAVINPEKIIYVKKDFPTSGQQSIWTVNIDGSNPTQIPITLPTNLKFYITYGSGEHSTARLSQDGQTVLFTLQNTGTGETYIYSCNIDGTNLQEVVAFDTGVGVFL